MSAESNDDGVRSTVVRAIRNTCGLSERFASPIADGILKALKHTYGDKLYLPNPRPDPARIRAAYDGTNRDELCKQWRISRATFYRLMNEDDVA